MTVLPEVNVDGHVTTYDNLGIPDMNTGARGRMHVQYSVNIPSLQSLTTEQKDLLRQLHNTFIEEEWTNENVSDNP